MNSTQPSGAQLSALKQKTTGLPPIRISEIVLQTGQYEQMRGWYESVLGGSWAVENNPKADATIDGEHGDGGKQVHASRVRSCFMLIDTSMPYGQVLALFEIPGTRNAPTNDPGLNHMQFKHAGIPALIERVQLLKDAGVHPHRSANHGPVTSFYYRDPDQNVVEFCSNNFETREEFLAFIGSDVFKKNPSGIDIDRDEFIKRFKSGIPLKELVRIV